MASYDVASNICPARPLRCSQAPPSHGFREVVSHVALFIDPLLGEEAADVSLRIRLASMQRRKLNSTAWYLILEFQALKP